MVRTSTQMETFIAVSGILMFCIHRIRLSVVLILNVTLLVVTVGDWKEGQRHGRGEYVLKNGCR